jgi:hypothetical protein
MVELTLYPIVLFLLVEPNLRKRFATQRAATPLEYIDHQESVVRLLAFDP